MKGQIKACTYTWIWSNLHSTQEVNIIEIQHVNSLKASFLFKNLQWLFTSSWIRLMPPLYIQDPPLTCPRCLLPSLLCRVSLSYSWLLKSLPVFTEVTLCCSPVWGFSAKPYTSLRRYSYRHFLFGICFDDTQFSLHFGICYDAPAVYFTCEILAFCYLNHIHRIYHLSA